jgi:hypothetical protein
MSSENEKDIFDAGYENEPNGTFNDSKKYKSLSPNVILGFKPVIVLAHLQMHKLCDSHELYYKTFTCLS